MTTALYPPASWNQPNTQLPLLLRSQRRLDALRLEFRVFWLSTLLPVLLQLGLPGREVIMAQHRAWERWRRDSDL